MTTLIGPKTLAQTLYPYYVKARKRIADRDEAYELEARAAWKEGLRPHYCKHGTNLWVDYDPICGGCESEYTPLEEAVGIASSWHHREQTEHEWQVVLAYFTSRNGERNG